MPEPVPTAARWPASAAHGPDDPRLGQPLSPDCYDYTADAARNAAAGELWRRTKQDIERHLIGLTVRLGHDWTADGIPPVRVSHGKAAEYQARAAVHFHVLLPARQAP
jgi:hypothetical protein